MAESMENRMGRIFREMYLDVFKNGTPEERSGEISRSRFNRTVARAIGCRNEPRTTNGYWGTAQDLGYIVIERTNPLSGLPQTFERARVREDIWANDGFILAPGETIQDAILRTSKRGRRRGTIEILDLRGMRP